MPSPRRIALLGTGIMGGHMARRLAQAGFFVTAWNRTRDKAGPLAQFGVRVADTPSAACSDADIIIVMLSNGPVVEEVLFSADSAGRKPAESLRPGSALVVMSSIPVEICRDQAARLRPRDIHYIDAPVSGGEPGARDGTLAVMAGGDGKTIESLADVFAALGRVTRVGPVGAGQLSKLANQIIVGATMAAVAEALHFAACGGADPAAVRRALMGGFADSKILNIHGERMIARNFVPGGPAEYELKDLRTAQAFATVSGSHFTLLDCVAGMFGDMIGHFGNGLDVAGILQEVERRAKNAGTETSA
jgi:3-hydroxyisobutyrate dehydrogenase-like beta-hydroxyacid dehydrogenase